MSSDEDSTSNSSPDEVRNRGKGSRKPKKQKDRERTRRVGGRFITEKAPPKTRRTSSKSTERRKGRGTGKKGKTEDSEEEEESEEESTSESTSSSEEEVTKGSDGQPVPRKKKRKAPKHDSDYFEEMVQDLLSRDIKSKEIFTSLRQQDSKFTGILSDFTLPPHRIHGLLEDDPGLSSKFEEAAPVEDAEEELIAAARTIQSGIHYLIKALGQLARQPATARKYLTSSLALTLHGFGRLHSNMVGKMVGVTEDMKQLVALKKHTGRDMRDVIDDAFFRAGGGSLVLSAASAAPMAPHTLGTRPLPMGPPSFPRTLPPVPYAGPPGPPPFAPPRFPPPRPFLPPPRSRAPFNVRTGGAPRGRPRSYSPQRGDIHQGTRARSPFRRH
jgi:hypothetical protein